MIDSLTYTILFQTSVGCMIQSTICNILCAGIVMRESLPRRKREQLSWRQEPLIALSQTAGGPPASTAGRLCRHNTIGSNEPKGNAKEIHFFPLYYFVVILCFYFHLKSLAIWLLKSTKEQSGLNESSLCLAICDKLLTWCCNVDMACCIYITCAQISRAICCA